MLKSQNKSTSIEKCEYDIRASIDLDCITSLLIGEKEFYYYLIKYDMFLKTTLKVIWIDEQEKGNNIKVKAIGKDGDDTYIDYDREIIRKTKQKQTFEEFWKIFVNEFDQIEFSNTDTVAEITRIQKSTEQNSIQHVKRRYKKLLLKYHPDKNKSENMQEKTNGIILAYKLIIEHEFLPNPVNMLGFLTNIWNDDQIDNPESLMHASVVDEHD